MRWLATHYIIGAGGGYERILTAPGDEGITAGDMKLLSDPYAADRFPKNYERRATPDAPFKGTVKPLETALPEGCEIKTLPHEQQ